MVQHWLFRIGDGKHFESSSKYNIWGINSQHSTCKKFIREVKPGDGVWFVKGGNNGLLIGVAEFSKFQKRIIGPLITISKTNEELGWTEKSGNWDTELHYNNLKNIKSLKLFSEIKGPGNPRIYNDKCAIDLPKEFNLIYKYSSIVDSFKI